MFTRSLTWVGAVAFAFVLVACGDSGGGGAAGRGNQDAGGTGGSGGGGGSGGAGSGGGSSGAGGSAATGCADVTCAANATCNASGSSPTCECDAGYTGDGDTSCDDIDECGDGSDNCHAEASCANTVGSFTCTCNDGYEGDGTDCSDTNECAANTDTCDPNAACSNETPGFDCACGDGYDGDGFGCGDVDECADSSAFECADNASCRNTFGAYACDCDPLFTGDGKTECDGLCEVALNNPSVCSPDGLCRITNDMGAICDACAGGLVGDGRLCDVPNTACGPGCDGLDGEGIDEEITNAICCASAGTDDPATACDETGPSCQCAPGYTGDPAGAGCTDIDECASNDGGCGAHSDCQNLPGGHICVCDAGYRKNNSGECVDIDECDALPFPCHPDADCTNSDGGFSCECKSGYDGDGGTCRDIDECASGDDDCAGGASCKNTRGGFICEDVDECALGLDNCDANASCTNDDPGFQCECDSGFAGDGNKCVCELSGYWAMRQDATLVWPAQKLQGLTTVACGCVKTTIWELHKYDYDGNLIEVQKKGCGSESGPDLVSPLFGNGETYSSYVPFETFDGVDLDDARQAGVDVPLPDAVPGLSFSTPKEAAVVGIDLGDDPLNAPWPAANELVNAEGDSAPAWVDDDDDGVPGLTLWPAQSGDQWFGASSGDNCGNGMRSCTYDYFPVYLDPTAPVSATERAGCVSAATRVVTRLDADIESCDRIVGDVINVQAEGRFHSCLKVGPTFDPADTDPPPSAWAEEVTCTADDWDSGTLCTEFNVDVFDNAGQSQSSGATFELVKIADLDDGEPSCDDVRTSLPPLGVRACSDACSDN